ncbi:MAG: hypothetical protein CYPHOPRED_004137 [Cyphobasidiales sp. Tagirdzhanova-0007]|nr:MAG: hypothetical protein CYPHOPRED_004137 [Cyphobasidiales sp. Tagirdzhanova-0007]
MLLPRILHRARLSTSPAWNNASLAAVRDKYEQKYAHRLQQKAREQGLRDVEELKAKSAQEGRLKTRVKEMLSKPSTRPSTASSLSASATQQRQLVPPLASDSAAASPSTNASKTPVKPLSDMVDLPKLLPQSATAIGALWTAYHQLKPNTLSAVIPADIYVKMSRLAKSYPQFVVPLPKEVQGEQGTGVGAEMHFLQWAFLPATLADPSAPRPSTVLYTPLGHYQAQQTFAQPHVILTHYVDLVPSHGIVLMRGDVTESVSTKTEDAQLLVLRLQQFYQGSNRRRDALLRRFHERPQEFNVEELVQSVGEV